MPLAQSASALGLPYLWPQASLGNFGQYHGMILILPGIDYAAANILSREPRSVLAIEEVPLQTV